MKAIKDYLRKKEKVMIAKKKGLYLGLLVSLLGIGNVMQAVEYTITIQNSTPYTVKFRLSFVRSGFMLRCWPKEKKLAAGDIAKINVKSCIVKSLEATVRRSGYPAVKAQPYRPHLGKTGSMTFTISGSDETGYTIAKVRNI